ncbi:MAG: hypothetical protein IKN97_10025 [Lachnospiraceae bacterium]|nr:hypothetical protein [Lachnospiraceae bacterium]
MDDGNKRLLILAAVGCMFVGGIILWFLSQMNDGENGVANVSYGSGDGWDIYYNPGSGSGDGGYGNGSLGGGSGDGGYGNGSLGGGSGDGGYGNGSLGGGSGDGGYGNGSLGGGSGDGGYGNGSIGGGSGDGGYGGSDRWNGGGNGGYGGRDGEAAGGGSGSEDITSSEFQQAENGIFGDERWDNYVSDLFVRISPDYAVDTLEVLRSEGVELFIRAAELCGSTGKETYAGLEDDVARQRWNDISEDVHTARYLWQLDEIILWYTLKGANWKDTREYADFQAYMEKNITDYTKRQEALVNGSFYHIITDLRARMAGKALGCSWDEAMDRVLLTAGDPLAEVVVRQEDYVPSDGSAAGNNGTAYAESDNGGMVSMIVTGSR